MSNYTRFPDPASGIKIYPSVIDFPANPGKDGVQAVAADTNTIYIFDTATNSWQAVANPGAAIAIDGLKDDVSATGPGVVSATVNSVGGASAGDIASATNEVLAATAAATPSTLAKRDASANSAFNILKVSDGSALAPSYTFSNSLTTGLFSLAANTLNLSTNGVERMAITSSGNVGIGTSSPNAKLQINNSGTQLGLSVYSTSSNNTVELYNQGTTNYTLALNSAANSAFTGASIGGYFARGTLSARAQTLANDTLLSISASGYTGAAVAGISAGIAFAADENTSATAFGGQIVFATTPNSTVQPLPSARMVIKNSGKVGINTLTPSEQLEVSGNTKSTNFYSGNGTAAAPSYTFSNSLGTGMYLPAANTLSFSTSGSRQMTITSAGDVGIGTSTPSKALSVNGSGISSYGYYLYADTTTGMSWTGVAGEMQFVSSNVEALKIRSNQKIKISTLTASQLVATDASQNLQSLDTATYPSLTEISYVKGVTSDIQTQLNNKQPFAQVVRITKSANYNLASTDDYIGCDSSAASFTLSLPAANTVSNGKKFIIKDEGGNAGTFSIFIAPSGTDKIDGVNASTSLDVGYESLTLVCNGADAWFII